MLKKRAAWCFIVVMFVGIVSTLSYGLSVLNQTDAHIYVEDTRGEVRMTIPPNCCVDIITPPSREYRFCYSQDIRTLACITEPQTQEMTTPTMRLNDYDTVVFSGRCNMQLTLPARGICTNNPFLRHGIVRNRGCEDYIFQQC